MTYEEQLYRLQRDHAELKGQFTRALEVLEFYANEDKCIILDLENNGEDEQGKKANQFLSLLRNTET